MTIDELVSFLNRQYMKCDGLPDPVCVRELNTYLSLWQEDDSREDIDAVLERTQVRKQPDSCPR